MANTVIIPIQDNQGYSPDQIHTKVTLQELLESVQEAIEKFGADATVVLANGQQYGAQFGSLVSEWGDGISITDAADE